MRSSSPYLYKQNCISEARGPWTPKFEPIFKKAGIDLDDAINKVAVPGHKGPHPEEYHSYVYDELSSATSGLKPNSSAYRAAVERTLDRIATEATTLGSKVNRWLTKQ
ncbi:AHH domain-containing protein [Nitrospira sp. M1]